MTNVLDKFIHDVKANVPGYIAVSVTEIRSGVSYAADSADPNFDPNLASAYNLEVIKAAQMAIEALGLGGRERIQDIVITLTDQIHAIDVAGNGSYFIYLVMDATKTNVGLARAFVSKYKRDLESVF